MSRFNTTTAKPTVHSPVVSEAAPSGRTHEGAAGYAREAKSELFLLTVSNMVGTDTFYEKAGARDARFEQLVHQVAVEDPAWMSRFIPWLRSEANMRTASLVAAVEFVKGRLDHPTDMGVVKVGEHPKFGGIYESDGFNRKLIAAACQRADEPGELLAYWTSRYGRAIPKPVKRGLADAAARLYNERSLLKYDTDSKGYRFGDVIDLVHPSPADDKPWQGDLFQYALDRRHNRANGVPERLQTVWRNGLLRSEGEPADWLNPDTLKQAGVTWEDALSAVGSKVDKAELWSALIPSMGYMALLRNLRNFDETGVPDPIAQTVAVRLADSAEVARSRQFPFRFLSAHRAVPSLRWAWPLEQALGHSLANIPKLGGRTLVLVDTSSSMREAFSKDGTLMRWDAAALFGIALGQRCASADVVSFSSARYYTHELPAAKTKAYPLRVGESLLKSLDRWTGGGYFLGGGTDTAAALRQEFKGHGRVVIVTDEQAAQNGAEVTACVPASVPMYTWNLAGYERGHAPSGGRNRHAFAGLTDQAFRMIPLLESGRDGTWPF